MAKIPVTFNVDAERCQDILTTAIEAGVHGSVWLRDYNAESEYNDHGALKLIIRDNGGEDGQKPVHRVIYIGDIAKALGLMLSIGAGPAEHAAQAMSENLDGPSADVVVQFAVFEEHVFA